MHHRCIRGSSVTGERLYLNWQLEAGPMMEQMLGKQWRRDNVEVMAVLKKIIAPSRILFYWGYTRINLYMIDFSDVHNFTNFTLDME